MSQKNSTHPTHQHTLVQLQFFSVAEVAAILGVSRKLVSTWISEGRLPVFRLGTRHRLIRIRKADLEQFIATHTHNQANPQTATPGSDLA